MQTIELLKTILDRHLNDKSGLPLYIQLADFFKEAAEDGTLKDGDLLPSEPELCEKLSISRSTVRKAFETLERQGLIRRERGKGTFLSARQNKRTLENIYSFTKEAKSAGLSTESELFSFEKVLPDTELSSRFKLEEGEMLFKIVRLRKVNGTPFLIETVFIPEHFCPGLKEEQLYERQLYRIIQEHYGVIPKKATEIYRITVMDQNEAQLLQCQAGTGAFFVQRISEESKGEVFEYAISLIRGDQCSVSAQIENNKVSFTRMISGT